jgi:hypothetical protein
MTTAPNSAAVPVAEPAAGEAVHSDLVAKLVAEAFSGLSRGARPAATPAVPAEIPGIAKPLEFPRLSTNLTPIPREVSEAEYARRIALIKSKGSHR